MKRKLIITSLLVISNLFMVGCVNRMDNPPTDSNKNITQRFTNTDFSYEIGDYTYKIIIDNATDNVYLHLNTGGGYDRTVDTFPLLDTDGKPVKFSSLKK